VTFEILGLGLVAPGVDDAHRVRTLPPLDEPRARRLPRLDIMALAAAQQALPPGTDTKQLSIVFGTGYGGLAATASFLESIATRGGEFGSAIAFQESVHHSPAGQLSILLNAHGPALTTSARELSGESALRVAMTLLETGRSERVLVVAADECTPALEAGYRAFDAVATHSGSASTTQLQPGEGAAAVLLGTGSGTLCLESCSLTAHRCPVLRFPSIEQLRPLLLQESRTWEEAGSFSLAAPNAAVLASERELLMEIGPSLVQWVDTQTFGVHPSAGLLRVVAAARRVEAEAAGSPCAVHGVAMGGGQSLTVVRHARA